MNLKKGLATLPDEWPVDLLPQIQARLKANGRLLIVLDDDPTGTQTVHHVPVLTEWTVATLKTELARDDVTTLYILTNSRSLPEAKAIDLNLEIGRHVVQAAQAVGREFDLISRSDSTLRGHFPVEVEALASGVARPYDGWLLIPFFLEGGRYTLHDVHYVVEGDQLIPAAETPFAKDVAFGYRASNLRDWIVEKSRGRITHANISAITLKQLRQEGPTAVAHHLHTLPQGSVCIVNAASYRDLEVLVAGLLDVEARGKQYLYRTAASFVRVRAGLTTRPLLTLAELTANQSTTAGGLILVGSYVPKTTRQLSLLLTKSNSCALELNVEHLLDDKRRVGTLVQVTEQIETALSQGRDVVVFTSRHLVIGDNVAQSLKIGKQISDSFVQIVQQIKTRPRFLIAKGGITSSDVATKGLAIKRALVMGQILPGVPVWQAGPESRYPYLPYVVFPGNVGGEEALWTAVHMFRDDGRHHEGMS